MEHISTLYALESNESIRRNIRKQAQTYRAWRREHALFLPNTPTEVRQLLPQLEESAEEMSRRINRFSEFVDDTSTLESTYKGIRKMIRAQSKGFKRGWATDFAEDFVNMRLKDKFYQSAMNSMWGESLDNDTSLISEETAGKIARSFLVCDLNLKYVALKGIPPFTNPNPFEPAVNLVELGALALHIDKNTLRADIPTIIDGEKRVLFCWQQGAPLNQYHNWDVSCSDMLNRQRF